MAGRPHHRPDAAAAPDADALAAEVHGVRDLVRHLVRDAASADDVAQQAWMAALATRPPEGATLRAWLAGIARNLARRLARAESRRERREHAAARPEAASAEVDLVERAETHRRVVDAVLALDEPYRTTLLQRFFEDLTPAQIAARTGTPAATVRSRLKRGLELVREHVGGRDDDERRPNAGEARQPKGGSAACVPRGCRRILAPRAGSAESPRRALALAALAWPRRTGLGTPAAPGAVRSPATNAPVRLLVPRLLPLAGGLAVKKTVWAAVAILLLVLGAGTAVVLRAPARPAAASPAAGTIERPREGSTHRVRAAPEPETAPAPAAEPTAAPGPILVVGPDGAPVAGAEVETLTLPGAGALAVRTPPRRIGTTDTAGRVRWPERTVPFPAIVRASHADLAPGCAAAGSADEQVVVRLGRGFEIAGTVVDEDDRGVPGADVVATLVPSTNGLGTTLGLAGMWTRTARSQADGSFRIAGLPSSLTGLVAARADGFADGQAQWMSTGTRPVRVLLGRAFRATVRVTDRAGNALPGAYVAAFDGPRLEATPDIVQRAVVPFRDAGGGLYVRDDLAAGWYQVLVAHAGHRVVVQRECGFQRGTSPVEVVLDETPGLRGRVVDADTREPIAGARVRVFPLAPGIRPGTSEEQAYWEPTGRMDGAWIATTGPDGSFEVSVAGPGDDVMVWVSAAGHTHHGWPQRGITAEQVREIALRPLAANDYSGRVVSTSGEPVPGAIVRGEAESVTADADGRFRLVTRQMGDWISVMAPGFASRMLAAPGHDIRGGGLGTKDFGDVALAPLVVARGVVVDGDDRPVAGLYVSAMAAGRLDLPRGTLFNGDGAVTDADGRVALSVTPGDAYRVTCGFGESRVGEASIEGGSGEEFRLVAGPDADADAGRVRGRLRLEDGTWTPTLAGVNVPTGRGRFVKVVVALPDGSFEIDGVLAGRREVRAASSTVEGIATDVEVPVRGVVPVTIVCRTREPVAPVETVPLAVRVDDAPPETAVWATRAEGRQRSARLRRTPESLWTAAVRKGGAYTVWTADATGRRAGVVTGVDPSAAEASRVELVAAGRLFLPTPDDPFAERWVEVRNGAGDVVWSGAERELPGIPGEGYYLVLPPGDWKLEVSAGLARRDPQSFRGTVVAGATSRAAPANE